MKKVVVLFAAVSFVVVSAVSGMASDWSFYGSARMSTFMYDESKEVSGTGFDERDLTWDLQPNSRVGAKVKDGPIGARIEFSPEANKMVRLFYGTWKLGVSTILVGQDYTPVYYPISSQAGRCDAALKGYGVFYAKRIPQLKLTLKGFQVALVQPRATNVVPGAGDTETSLPKVEASYSFSLGPVALYLAGGYNSHEDIVTTGSTERKYKIDSTIYGLGFKFAPGPLYLNGTLYGGTNPGNFGLSDECDDVITTTAAYNGTTDSVEDVDTIGCSAVLGVRASPMVTLEAGYGMVRDEYDIGATTTKAHMRTYYINATIKLAKGVCMVPEIGKIDYGELKVTGQPDTDAGDVTYYGAKWQISF